MMPVLHICKGATQASFSQLYNSKTAHSKDFTLSFADGVYTVTVCDVCKTLCIQFNSQAKLSENNTWERLFRLIEKIEKVDNNKKEAILALVNKNENPNRLLSDIMQLDLDKKVLLALGEIITAEY